MTLRKFLLLPLLVSIGFFAYYSQDLIETTQNFFNNFVVTPKFVYAVLASVTLQIIGHIIRAKKAEYLFSEVKDNTTRFQFRALSVGYLFNAILPFKLGELVRARIISGGLDVSFTFSLALIIFERALDALILGISGVLLLLLLNIDSSQLLIYTLGLIGTSVLILAAFRVITAWNKYVLMCVNWFTGLFKDRIANLTRFKVWSLIYGLQLTLNPKRLFKYFLYSLLSWVAYAASLYILVVSLITNVNPLQKLLASLAPYYGVSIPAGPANIGVFSKITNAFLAPLGISNADKLNYDFVAWCTLIIPISLIGLVLFFVKTKETAWRSQLKQSSDVPLDNKLDRTGDISDDMSSFLENYFAGNTLSHVVHKLELSENFRLVKYFKGGSDAITILAKQDGKKVVKKIIPKQYESRLKAQHDWLKSKSDNSGIVKVLREEKREDFYSIDLEYDKNNLMFFDFMHQQPIDASKKVLSDAWKILDDTLYKKLKSKKYNPDKLEEYIEKHIIGCIEQAVAVNTDLNLATKPKTLIINGKKYDNLYVLLKRFRDNKRAYKDAATFQESEEVHGDVAVDNILVNSQNSKPLLIDPAPDGNIINGPVFDFGKNMQALYCGYEFMLRDNSPVQLHRKNVINYNDSISKQYSELCDYVRNELISKRLSDEEQRAIIFHAAALHFRRLKHQVYYSPANTLKFYAIGVKTFSDFLDQYS